MRDEVELPLILISVGGGNWGSVEDTRNRADGPTVAALRWRKGARGERRPRCADLRLKGPAALVVLRGELLRAAPELSPQGKRVFAIDLSRLGQALVLQHFAPVVDQGDESIVDVGQAASDARGHLHSQHSQVVIVAELPFEFVKLISIVTMMEYQNMPTTRMTAGTT